MSNFIRPPSGFTHNHPVNLDLVTDFRVNLIDDANIGVSHIAFYLQTNDVVLWTFGNESFRDECYRQILSLHTVSIFEREVCDEQ